MWLHYEDKGQYIGMTDSKQNMVSNFISDAMDNDEVFIVESDVKLPNFDNSKRMKVMFDVPSLMTEINMDCLNCHEVHTHRSCCGGVPYPFDINHIVDLIYNGSLIQYVRPEFRNNLISCRDNKDYSYIYSDVKRTFIGLENSEGQIECPMRDYDRCGLHHYMLDHNIPYYLKPCTWLYPYEILMEIDKKLEIQRMFVCVQTLRTALITRWGENSCHRHCLDKKLNDYMDEIGVSEIEEYKQRKCNKNKYFKDKDYKSAYKCFFGRIYILFW